MIYSNTDLWFHIDISLGELVSNRKRLRESEIEPMMIQDLNLENLISSKKVDPWVSNTCSYKITVDSFPAPLAIIDS